MKISEEKNSGINVVSLFNGMSTGHFALNNLGIKINNYYSSELKNFANELQKGKRLVY